MSIYVVVVVLRTPKGWAPPGQTTKKDNESGAGGADFLSGMDARGRDEECAVCCLHGDVHCAVLSFDVADATICNDFGGLRRDFFIAPQVLPASNGSAADGDNR